MTTETQITVKFVNEPKDGNRNGSVKTDQDQFYGVDTKDLHQFKPGGVYAIEYVERSGTGKWTGRTFRDIKSAKLVSNAPAASSNGAASSHSGNGQFRNPEQMFVEAILVKGLETNTIPFTEQALTANGLMLQTVWQRLWGAQ